MKAAKSNQSAGKDIKTGIPLLLPPAGDRTGEEGERMRRQCDSQSQRSESHSRGGEENEPTEATMLGGPGRTQQRTTGRMVYFTGQKIADCMNWYHLLVGNSEENISRGDI